MDEFEISSSPLEKLTLLVLISAILIGNFCVFVTYFVRATGKHWSHMFVLGMAFIDLVIGGFVLPMHFQSAYGNPLTPKLCIALSVGESCALASMIYAIGFMVFTRLYDLKQTPICIHRRYIVISLVISWLAFFLFYGIPFMTNYSSYRLTVVPSTANITSYCLTYETSVYHSNWMAYTEIVIIYTLPICCIGTGIVFLVCTLCQEKTIIVDKTQRNQYRQQKKMTWHVIILAITFIILWLPWITIRISTIFQTTYEIKLSMKIAFYVLMLKSMVFPILYASTNESFRGSFAIYRHKRVTISNRVWTINEHSGY